MVLLINPPDPKGYISNKDTMGGLGQLYSYESNIKVPPIDIFHIAAILANFNIPVKIIDYLIEEYNEKEIVKLLYMVKPKLIGIRVAFPIFDFNLEFAHFLKKISCEYKVLLFGPYLHFIDRTDVEKIQKYGIEYYTGLDLTINFIALVLNLLNINYQKDLLDKYNANTTEGFNNIPFPKWQLVDYWKYRVPFFKDEPFLPILSSKGCIYGCSYCPYVAVQGYKFINKSAEKIIDEIEFIYKQLGIKNILFRDPFFTNNINRVDKICNGIIAKNMKIKWVCETKVESLNEEIIYKMAKAGCFQINFGIESFNKFALINSKRKIVNVNKLKKIIEYCRKYKIKTFGFFIIGFPEDDKFQVLNTIAKAINLNLDMTQFTYLIPYPGTPLFQMIKDKGYIIEKNKINYTSYKPVIKTNFLSISELKSLGELANFSILFKQQKIIPFKISFIKKKIKYLLKIIFYFLKTLN